MSSDDRSGKTSKYRHVYGENPKVENQYQELQKPLAQGEGRFVASNEKFFAVSKASGGGPVLVRRLDSFGRVPVSAPTIAVHRGKTWDMDFHPFINNMIATASDDCRVCVTQFPSDGLLETINEATVTLEGHSKKVILTKFNPIANSILASASFDRSVKVWNIESANCVTDFSDFGDTIYSMEWNYDGSMMATTSKDRSLRMFDPRAPEAVMEISNIFEGTKSSKVFWVPRHNFIGATGFNRTSKQELKLYALENLSEPVHAINFGVNNSVNMPYYDNDTSMLYLYGKGNGLIHYLEINEAGSSRLVYQLNTYRSPVPQKGGAWVPKKGLNVWKCEVARFLKLTAKDVLPISFIVPRKAGADIFQDDIFPDCYAGVPALDAEAWENGNNATPPLMTLDPARRGVDGGVGGASASATFVAKKSYRELEEEVQKLRDRVQELETLLGGGGGGEEMIVETESEAAQEKKDQDADEEVADTVETADGDAVDAGADEDVDDQNEE